MNIWLNEWLMGYKLTGSEEISLKYWSNYWNIFEINLSKNFKHENNFLSKF